MYVLRFSCQKANHSQECFSEHSCYVHTALVPLMTVDCSSCGKQFPSGLRGYLRSHINKSGPFHDGRCWSCSKQFHTWKEMNLHLEEEHGGVFKFLCGFCGINAFDSEERMKEHRYFCRVCPASHKVRAGLATNSICYGFLL